MAYRVKVVSVDGKYAVTEDGTRLRIIGDSVPRGYVYTDGIVAYGYAIKGYVPMMHVKGKKKLLVDILFDAMMNVRSKDGLAFFPDVGMWLNGAYPYKYEDYINYFSKKCTLPNVSYILGSSKLFSIEKVNSNFIFNSINDGTTAIVPIPSELGVRYWYDIGRGGEIAFAIDDITAPYNLYYIDGNSVLTHTYEHFQRAAFATGYFNVQSYTDISVDYPRDLNVDDQGNATCTVVAKGGNVTKKFKVEFSSALTLYNYDYADCGDATGDFDDSTDLGTIRVGNLTFPNELSGTKVTVTDDYIFLAWFNGIGTYTTSTGIELRQYDKQGNLLRDYGDDYTFTYINNTRLDLYYLDDLLRLWNAGEVIDIDEYFDTRMTVKPIRFDTRMKVRNSGS